MLKVKLHKGQLIVAKDKHRYRVVCAGRRWGKSVLSRIILLKWATEKVGRYWIVSPTYKQGKMIHWLELYTEIPPEWIEKRNEVELSITLKNGSVIELKGADNPDNLRGVKLMGLVVDEIASIRNWKWLWMEVLRPTLTDYEAPALFISSPKGYNHFYDIYEEGQKDEGQYKSWRFTSYDNPTIKSSEIDIAKKQLPPDVFGQEYMANFVRFTGLVYKEFDPQRHVRIFDHDKNIKGEYVFGLDFAVRGYTASSPLWIPTTGVVHILDNYKEEGKPAKVHAGAIKDMLKLYADFEKYAGYADPAGFMKNQQAGDMLWSLADEYIEESFPIVPANNKVIAGINYIKQLFLQDKIIIHPRCEKLIEELETYSWKEQTERQSGTKNEPEEVRKINDHLLDQMRYAIYSKTPPPPEEKPRPAMPIKFEMKLDPIEEKKDRIEFPTIYD